MRLFSRESGTNQRSALVVRSVRGARWFFLSTSAGDFFVSRGRKTEDSFLLFSRTVRAFLTELQTEDCFSTFGVKSQSFVCTSRWLPYRGEFYFICGGRGDCVRAWRMGICGLSVACSTPRQHVVSKPFCDCICFKKGNEVSFRGANILSGKGRLASFTGSQLFTRDHECPADAEAERLREEEKNITGGNLILTISSNTAHHEEPTSMQLLRLCNFSVSKSPRGSSLSSTHGRMMKLFSNAVDVSCDVLLLDWWVAYFG